MKTKAAVALFLGTVFVSCTLWAEDTPKESLLVLSKGDHTLAIVDPGTLKVVAKMPVGDDPHEVIASADGKTAYASNYGGGAFHTLAVLDLPGQKALASIDLGPLLGPHGLDFVGGKLWFTAEGSKAIGRYDPATKKVDWILGTGQNRTHMVFVASDLQWIVTTNVSSATVSIIEKSARAPMGPPPGMGQSGPPPGPLQPDRLRPPGGDWDETVIPVGKGSEGFDVSPDSKEIWVANAQDGTISIINRARKTVTDTLAANVKGANRLKFTPDGRMVLVSSLFGSDVVVFDSGTRKEVKRVPIGHGAAGIQMQPDGARAFVACTPDSYVAVIDLKTMEIAGHIDAGPQPDGLAWAVQR